MAKRSKAPELPPAHDWRTTDHDEIERRRLRAREGRFRIENLDPRHPILSTFLVHSASDRRYSVEVRNAAEREAGCDCVDFRVNGLGTCKHVEAVWLHLTRRASKAFRQASKSGSKRLEVVPDREAGTLRLVAPAGAVVPAALRKVFPVDGRLTPDADPQEAAAHLRKLGRESIPALRVSQEVDLWLEQRQRAEQRRELRRMYELKVQGGEWPPHETLVPLFPYQREGMLHLAFTERALLADEMGLGKTIQAIAACALLHRLGCARRVLVVTPASLKAEWEEQIRRFTPLPVHLVYGSRHKRLAFLRSLGAGRGGSDATESSTGTVADSRAGTAGLVSQGPFFIVMNYEQVVTDLPEVNELLQPDVVVLDEAQRIKNWNTKTALTIKRLRSRYAFILTGTPIENRIDELRSLVDFLDPSVLGPLFRFNREFYELDDRGRPAGYCNLTLLHKRVSPVLLRRRKAEVETELPPRTDRNLFVQMTDKQRRAYAEHEQEVTRLASIAERRPLTPKEQDLLQIQLAMMRMVCDTPFILDPKDRTCPKLPEVARILEDCRDNDAKVIVFSEWEGMLKLVREWCQENGFGHAWHTGSVPQQSRRAQINSFKTDPECRVFLSTDAGATGLNLQNASVVVNCDLPWNPARLEQRIARAWRKLQTRNVTVINLIAEDSIEHRMLDTLATKRAVADSVLDHPGSVDRIALRSGRKAMMERVRALIVSPSADASSAAAKPGLIERRDQERQQAREEFRQDPAATFARRAAARLGPALVSCEERFPHGGGAPVVCLVVERDVQGVRPWLEAVRQELCLLAGEDADVIQRNEELLAFEVVDRATHQAIERLVAAGLVVTTTAFTRPLAMADEPSGTPPLTDAEEARLHARHDQARHALRRARVLGGAGFSGECRASLLEAGLHAAAVLAILARTPEPPTLEASLAPGFARHWGPGLAVLQSYLQNPEAPWLPVADAIGSLLEERSVGSDLNC